MIMICYFMQFYLIVCIPIQVSFKLLFKLVIEDGHRRWFIEEGS